MVNGCKRKYNVNWRHNDTPVQTNDTHLDLHGRHRYEKQQCVKYVSDTNFWTYFLYFYCCRKRQYEIHIRDS